MTFKWNITLPPFHGVANGVEVSRAGIALEFETGSIAEAHGIFSDNGTALSETFGNLLMGRAMDVAGEGTTEAPAAKRGRGPNKPKATAPEPLAMPAPVAPPPAPPAVPPTGILAGKVAAELDRRATGAADGGQALADWLATSGIIVKGATYSEAIIALRLQADEKLGPIATALGVS